MLRWMLGDRRWSSRRAPEFASDALFSARTPRLSVRSAKGEVPLERFQRAASADPLDEHTLAAVAAGVWTRRYVRTLDPVPAEVNERATSSSAV